MPTLSVVVPCYNECDVIATLIPRLLDLQSNPELCELCGTVEILVVDDASDDGSTELLQGYSSLRVIRNARKCGYGESLKTGFNLAQGDLIAFLDMDNTYRPEDLLSLVRRLLERNADIVWGNRFNKTSLMPMIRNIGNRFYSLAIQSIFNAKVVDSCSGMRVFRRELLPGFLKLKSESLDFSISMTLMCVLRSYSFFEVQIQYDERVGSSKLNWWSDGWIFLSRIGQARLFGQQALLISKKNYHKQKAAYKI